MKLNHIVEARLANRISVEEAIKKRLIESLVNGDPSDFGLRQSTWWRMNSSHQVGFMYSRNSYDYVFDAIVRTLNIDQETLENEGISPRGFDHLLKGVLRLSVVKQAKNQFKGEYAMSGTMSEKIRQQLKDIDYDLEKLTNKREELKQQLEKLDKIKK